MNAQSAKRPESPLKLLAPFAGAAPAHSKALIALDAHLSRDIAKRLADNAMLQGERAQAAAATALATRDPHCYERTASHAHSAAELWECLAALHDDPDALSRAAQWRTVARRALSTILRIHRIHEHRRRQREDKARAHVLAIALHHPDDVALGGAQPDDGPTEALDTSALERALDVAR